MLLLPTWLFTLSPVRLRYHERHWQECLIRTEPKFKVIPIVKNRFLNLDYRSGWTSTITRNTGPVGVEKCGRDDVKTPTFWEFVRALLDGYIDVDDHWSPIYISCSLCRVSYDVILHFEYLSDEQSYFLRQLGLENLLGIEKLQLNKNPNRLTPEERRAYFLTLDESEINALYQFYFVDFDLFQYDLKSYLHTDDH